MASPKVRQSVNLRRRIANQAPLNFPKLIRFSNFYSAPPGHNLTLLLYEGVVDLFRYYSGSSRMYPSAFQIDIYRVENLAT